MNMYSSPRFTVLPWLDKELSSSHSLLCGGSSRNLPMSKLVKITTLSASYWRPRHWIDILSKTLTTERFYCFGKHEMIRLFCRAKERAQLWGMFIEVTDMSTEVFSFYHAGRTHGPYDLQSKTLTPNSSSQACEVAGSLCMLQTNWQLKIFQAGKGCMICNSRCLQCWSNKHPCTNLCKAEVLVSSRFSKWTRMFSRILFTSVELFPRNRFVNNIFALPCRGWGRWSTYFQLFEGWLKDHHLALAEKSLHLMARAIQRLASILMLALWAPSLQFTKQNHKDLHISTCTSLRGLLCPRTSMPLRWDHSCFVEQLQRLTTSRKSFMNYINSVFFLSLQGTPRQKWFNSADFELYKFHSNAFPRLNKTVRLKAVLINIGRILNIALTTFRGLQLFLSLVVLVCAAISESLARTVLFEDLTLTSMV